MTALEWIRSKAELVSAEVITLTDEYATDESPPGRYESRLYAFRGNLPRRMKRELLAASAAGELVTLEHDSEQIQFPGQYKSDSNFCRYFRNTYTRIDG